MSDNPLSLKEELESFLRVLTNVASSLPQELKVCLLKTNTSASEAGDQTVACNLLHEALTGRWGLDPADLVLILHCAVRLMRADGGPCDDITLTPHKGPPPGWAPIPRPSDN
jgi:hypothetical protein